MADEKETRQAKCECCLALVPAFVTEPEPDAWDEATWTAKTEIGFRCETCAENPPEGCCG